MLVLFIAGKNILGFFFPDTFQSFLNFYNYLHDQETLFNGTKHCVWEGEQVFAVCAKCC